MHAIDGRVQSFPTPGAERMATIVPMPATAPSDADRRRLAARLMPLLDLTSLGEDDTPARIEALCAGALAAPVAPAAVCVYPEHVAGARRALDASGIRVATVVNFPEGSDDPARVERETRRAIAAGADEVDMVLPWRALREDRAGAVRYALLELAPT